MGLFNIFGNSKPAIKQVEWVEDLLEWRNQCNISSSKLPNTEEALLNLTKLDIGEEYDEKIQYLPTSLFNLKNLTDLNLRGCNLAVIPIEISKLEKLENLNLMWNKISELPAEIGNLYKLKNLNLCSCFKINRLPKEIGLLSELKELTLPSDTLLELPDEICNLKKLEVLKIGSNKKLRIGEKHKVWLRELKENRCILNISSDTSPNIDLTDYAPINKLYQWADDNRIGNKIPRNVEDLQNLTQLHLYSLNLQTIPKELNILVRLNLLFLLNNNLTVIPEEISEITGLSTLNLENNRLLNIPQRIGDLVYLKELNLKDNPKLRITGKFISTIQKLRKNGCEVILNDDKESLVKKVIDSGLYNDNDDMEFELF